MLGRTDIPVAKGMTEPMSRDVPKEPFTHGTDGQAENFLPDPVTPLCKKHGLYALTPPGLDRRCFRGTGGLSLYCGSKK